MCFFASFAVLPGPFDCTVPWKPSLGICGWSKHKSILVHMIRGSAPHATVKLFLEIKWCSGDAINSRTAFTCRPTGPSKLPAAGRRGVSLTKEATVFGSITRHATWVGCSTKIWKAYASASLSEWVQMIRMRRHGPRLPVVPRTCGSPVLQNLSANPSERYHWSYCSVGDDWFG